MAIAETQINGVRRRVMVGIRKLEFEVIIFRKCKKASRNDSDRNDTRSFRSFPARPPPSSFGSGLRRKEDRRRRMRPAGRCTAGAGAGSRHVVGWDWIRETSAGTVPTDVAAEAVAVASGRCESAGLGSGIESWSGWRRAIKNHELAVSARRGRPRATGHLFVSASGNRFQMVDPPSLQLF